MRSGAIPETELYTLSPRNQGRLPPYHVGVFTNQEAPLSFGEQSFSRSFILEP